jgi:fructose-1,6-bisphosphatase/inositol monophosphatase family enzyme
MTILFIVWGVFLVGLLALLAYNATLTRYEEDQLFLNDTNDNEKQHQTEILTKLHRTQPFVRVFGSGSVVLTLVLAGMFAWDAIQRLR